MNSISLQSPAKINFALKILSRRSDGYHDLETVLQQVLLSDFIHLQSRGSGIKLTCTDYSLANKENLVYRAAALLRTKLGLNKGVEIHLEKNIPIAAGLGGGSSNAALTLWGLNQLWELGLTKNQLMTMASELGADIPFFLCGGRALGTGRGDQLQRLDNNHKIPILLINPGLPISTAWVYQHLNLRLTNNRNDIKLLTPYLKVGNIKKIGELIFNDLESVVLPRFPILTEIKELLLQSGAAGSIVSGSGPTVLALFENQDIASRTADTLRDLGKRDWRIFSTETLTEHEVVSIFQG